MTEEQEARHYISPNGKRIIGALERTPCCCNISGILPDGSPEYSGRSDMFWDDTRPDEIDGKILYLDSEYETWTFNQLSLDIVQDD